jgi:hypothetical protein
MPLGAITERGICCHFCPADYSRVIDVDTRILEVLLTVLAVVHIYLDDDSANSEKALGSLQFPCRVLEKFDTAIS